MTHPNPPVPTGSGDERPAPLVEVHDGPDELATAIAGELLNRISDSQAAGNIPDIGLTGGSIARAVHREVARLADDSGVDWGAVRFFFGDERFVPAADPERNVGQARDDLLDVVGARQVFTAPASDEVADLEESASQYAATVQEQISGELEVLMLGIGPDGHVASLFPDHPALAVIGTEATGVSDSPKPPPERVTLTFDTLNRAQCVWFLVSGEGKAEAVARALAETGSIEETPARGVHGRLETVWFLDREAASRL
ncbi:6-phosphogluconolactonase [Nocardioides sp. zg-536]|uniref:6-phosphogluconolactonase n=1 Tax=Nocardioides faecalis TaxID=2803858 RepID=A0A939BX28_9ACTN|nr:6-phosphogluconolactonase [Nocardioides faecalis]MBM9458953.1 6-phosphogluconolactonase [Nocardioides faecalis]MBS4753945.1 6-phosphogluconolactonase [Nocardioides faecalis]QVI60349.1 6-phosphogluconolactonase [Nocardioides faecalis]